MIFISFFKKSISSVEEIKKKNVCSQISFKIGFGSTLKVLCGIWSGSALFAQAYLSEYLE